MVDGGPTNKDELDTEKDSFEVGEPLPEYREGEVAQLTKDAGGSDKTASEDSVDDKDDK